MEALKIITDSMKEKKLDKIKGTAAEKFLKIVSKKFGNYSLAFTTVSSDQISYDSSGKFTTKMGLLNVNNLSWKWNTERDYTKGLLPVPFEAAVQQTAQNSINDLKKENNGKLY